MRRRYGYANPYGYDPYGCPYAPEDDPKWVNPRTVGEPMREKQNWPYSYDEFFIFGSKQMIEQKSVNGVYSDRVWQWWVEQYKSDDKKKSSDAAFDELWKKHIGTRYERASATQLSAFFTEYNQTLWPKENKGKRAVVVALAEGCNGSNGYPYWIVWYRTEKA